MGLSKNITLTIKDYEIRLDKQIKFYENDTIDLCFSILEYGIEVKDGVSINKLMPIQALTSYMLIETPQGVDYAESTKIEDNKIVFNLGAKYSQFVGIGHMQIVIKDSDGCRVTLPEFEFEIKKSINSDWERDCIFLATEDDSIIIDEFGREIRMSKISDMPISENLSEESYTMIIDEEGNKRLKVRAIADAVEDSLDTKFNAYADEISGDVERIEGEVNEIGESLDNLESEVNELKEGNINIDSTNYATKTELSLKVDKETGKSLISDSEIERLSTLKNYDDSNIKNTLNSKADKSELHSHSNKSVLDGITSSKVTEWNNKSTFDGNYNSLTNKPTIPTLTGYATEQYVNEKIDEIDVTDQLTDYAKKSELHDHSNKSILDGITSSKVTEWNNKSTFDGNYNSLANKPTIPTKTSQLNNDSGFITSIPSEYITESELNTKGYLKVSEFEKLTLGYHTDGKIYLFNDNTILGNGVEIGMNGDVIGYIDSANNIILSGALANDTYTVKYEMEDGTYLDIGSLSLGSTPIEPEEPEEPEETEIINQIPISVTTTGELFVGTNGEKGYKTGYRVSSSSGSESALANYEITGFIPVKLNDTVYIKNITVADDGQSNIAFYKTDKTFITGVYTSTFFDTSNGDVMSGVASTARFTKLTSDVGFIRISSKDITENSIITVNQSLT